MNYNILKWRNISLKKHIIKVSVAVMSLVALSQVHPHLTMANYTQGLVSKSHLTTKDGWSNDLQSIVWNETGNYYDIYFLHSVSADNVFGDEGQNWYHTTTKDFKTYTEQSQAIPSHGGDPSQGWKSAWTGSIIENKDGRIEGVPKGAKVAYFSGLRKSDGKQNIWASYSSDGGKTFTHELNGGKPVADTSNASNKSDFRDPYVFTFNGKYFMYVAEGSEIGVYQSTNGLSWTHTSKITHNTFFKGRSWDGNAPIECPVLKTMSDVNGNQKQVLFFGAKDASRGETTGTYYIVGHLDHNGSFINEGDVQRLDQGSDYYGANFSGSTDVQTVNKEIVSLGWIGNWNYTADGVHSDEYANSGYIERLGSYSSARKLTLTTDGKIHQAVVLPSELTRKTYEVTKDRPINPNNGNKLWIHGQDTNGNIYGLYDLPHQSASQTFDLTLTNSKGNYDGRIYFDIWQGGDYIRFNYDTSTGWYVVNARAGELDRSQNGQKASYYYYDGLLGNGKGYSADSGVSRQKSINLKVVTDKTSVEIFFPNGKSYTIARFSNSDIQDFKIFTEDPTGANKIKMTVSNNK